MVAGQGLADRPDAEGQVGSIHRLSALRVLGPNADRQLQPGRIPSYSPRSTTIGSSRAARWAGSQEAAIATTASTITPLRSVSGSVALT